mmetsp:Transcript_3180/g.5948  ORF Transcript_3180/g.5948 Transcript_3180/m.5948 type:complete len:430 (-) Transcript_3180:755-2044(-)
MVILNICMSVPHAMSHHIPVAIITRLHVMHSLRRIRLLLRRMHILVMISNHTRHHRHSMHGVAMHPSTMRGHTLRHTAHVTTLSVTLSPLVLRLWVTPTHLLHHMSIVLHLTRSRRGRATVNATHVHGITTSISSSTSSTYTTVTTAVLIPGLISVTGHCCSSWIHHLCLIHHFRCRILHSSRRIVLIHPALLMLKTVHWVATSARAIDIHATSRSIHLHTVLTLSITKVMRWNSLEWCQGRMERQGVHGARMHHLIRHLRRMHVRCVILHIIVNTLALGVTMLHQSCLCLVHIHPPDFILGQGNSGKERFGMMRIVKNIRKLFIFLFIFLDILAFSIFFFLFFSFLFLRCRFFFFFFFFSIFFLLCLFGFSLLLGLDLILLTQTSIVTILLLDLGNIGATIFNDVIVYLDSIALIRFESLFRHRLFIS